MAALGLAALGVEVAGAQVTPALDLGLEPAEVGAEQVGQQAWAAVRLAAAVERHEHVVHGAERGQRPPAPGTPSTASHTGAVSSSRIDVARRNATASAGSAAMTSSWR